jgi:hypothetical protein
VRPKRRPFPQADTVTILSECLIMRDSVSMSYNKRYCHHTVSMSDNERYWLHNGDVLCFLWGTNWIYICYVEEIRPPLWSSGQSSWLQIQRPKFDSRHYQIFREVVGLEWGPLSLVSTTAELLDRKVATPVYKAENTAVRNRHADHVAPSILKSWH